MYLVLIGLMVLVAVICAIAACVDRSIRAQAGLGCLGSGLIAAVLTFLGTFTIVPPGHVGVPVVLGKVQEKKLGEGFNFVSPLAEVHHMSVRTESYTFSKVRNEGDNKGDDSITALSSNGMQIVLDITVPYRLVPEASPWVLRNFGPEYKEKILRPVICTAVREAVSHFSDQEAYSTKREELAVKMQERLLAQVNNLVEKEYKDAPKTIFSLPQVMIRNVGLPDEVKKAIERKIAAEQDNQRMEFTIKMERKKAEQRVIEAKGIKDFQDIVSQGVTPDLLRWKGIEATEELAKSPNTKIVIIGGKDGLPVILNSAEGK